MSVPTEKTKRETEELFRANRELAARCDWSTQLLRLVVDWTRTLRWDELPSDPEVAKVRLQNALAERERDQRERVADVVDAAARFAERSGDVERLHLALRTTGLRAEDGTLGFLVRAVESLVEAARPCDGRAPGRPTGRVQYACERCGALCNVGPEVPLDDPRTVADFVTRRSVLQARPPDERLHRCADGGYGPLALRGVAPIQADGEVVAPLRMSPAADGDEVDSMVDRIVSILRREIAIGGLTYDELFAHAFRASGHPRAGDFVATFDPAVDRLLAAGVVAMDAPRHDFVPGSRARVRLGDGV